MARSSLMKKPLALIAASLLLAACGGGGGGGGTPGNPPPAAVTITSPANAADGLSGTLALAATPADPAGVARIEFQVDGVAVGSDSTAPYGASVDTNAYASGQHVVRARAVDNAGQASAWASATVRFAGSRALPAGFVRNDAFVAGLTNATAFAQAPDGRLFIAEQGGTLRVVRNGVLLATSFITLAVDSSGERGLLGVALHPDFATNRWIYLHYTTTEGGAHGRISRYTANPSNPDIVSVGSEVRIADLPLLSGATNHNGGALHFGTDGKLYVGIGDNANGANAPNLATPLGKLLRFNDDGSIPTDNPFYATQTGLARAIWAYGLRNPFTFAVQPGTGRIHINDVGEGTWEEVDLGAAGADYGWPTTEGPTSTVGITAPLFAYRHTATAPPGTGPGGFFTGFSIAGGTFYPDAGPFPAPWRGNYFFADFVNRFVGALDLANGNAAYAFGTVPGNPVDLLVAQDGALLVLMRGAVARLALP